MALEKQFNTAGPCKPDKHYQIDPLDRIDYLSVLELIRDERYFVLHAPRQTGKTTSLIALVHHLNATGQYRAVYANIEGAQTARYDVSLGIGAVTRALVRQIDEFSGELQPRDWLQQHHQDNPNELLVDLLTYWCRLDQKPVVLMLDEVDALVGDTLVSLLRQLRSGYASRPARFPQSVILCGVRDIRDYRIHTQNQEIITGGSAFNVKAESLRVGNFNAEECQTLWSQHTQATGQVFDAAIFSELWEDTRGQPWLVNALGHELTWKNPPVRTDRTRPITLEDYRTARENLIQRRDTHLDQLIDKLREPRVQAVIGPLLVAEDSVRLDIKPDDQQYVEDLGLIRTRPEVTLANRIYAEIIPRELTWIAQTRITQQQTWFLRTDRSLDMPKLLAAFQQFFREHSESWLEHFDYKEAGPQLLLQAFLQRIVNGGGRIDREYGLGRKRTDLYIQWPLDEALGFHGPVQRIVLELKLWRSGSLEKVLETGLPQTADYARQCGAAEAHLLIFDRRPDSDWDQRIWQATRHQDGYAVQVWGS
jgi:hypothetical protein